MNKVVISGYYGFNNIGDESILTAIIANIKGNIDDIDITVLSKDPELTKSKHKVGAINRKDILKILSEIRNCDLLISGGGSLLQDVTSSRSILYYLAIMFIGKLFKKKVMIYSQGMGPINKKINQRLTRYILNKVDIITLRDEKSEKVLRDIDIENENIIVTADPVIGLRQGDISLGRDILKNSGLRDKDKILVGFAIRGRDKNKKLVETISSVADRIIDELGVGVVFIPFHHGEDVGIIEEIRSYMRNDCICLNGRYDINEMLSIVGNLDLLVGVRLHSLIFGAVMNIPMIAVSYDPKINNFMNYLDETVFSDIENLDKEKLIKEITYKINHEEECRLQLYNKIEYLKERLRKNEELISLLLNAD